jgi:hypothetical protein
LTAGLSFRFIVGEPCLFANDERTRSFVSLGIGEGDSQMCALIVCIDSVLRRYSQPEYYQNPQNHITVASMLGNTLTDSGTGEDTKRSGLKNDLSALGLRSDHPDVPLVPVSSIQCKIGDKLFDIPLKSDHDEVSSSAGLFGM